MKKLAPSAIPNVIVFDRTLPSLERLAEILTKSPELAKMRDAWIAEPSIEYLLVGTTGGRKSQVFTLGARDEQHLVSSVLPDVATIIHPSALATAKWSSSTPEMDARLSAAWNAVRRRSQS